MMVAMVAPAPRVATIRSAASTLAPDDTPAKRPYSRASRRAICRASCVETVTIPLTSAGCPSGRMKPMPIPSTILCKPDSTPERTTPTASAEMATHARAAVRVGVGGPGSDGTAPPGFPRASRGSGQFRVIYCVVLTRAPRISTRSIAALTSPWDFAFSTNLRA